MHYVTVVSMVYLTGYLRKRLNAKVLCNWVNISNIINAIFLQRLGCLFDWQNILARMREKDGFLERQGGALSGLPLQVPQPNVWHLQKPLTRCLIVGSLGVGKVIFLFFQLNFLWNNASNCPEPIGRPSTCPITALSRLTTTSQRNGVAGVSGL